MAGLALHACRVLAPQYDRLVDYACAVELIAEQAVKELEDDNAYLAGALRGAVGAIVEHCEHIRMEFKKAQTDPQWNGEAEATSRGEG